MINFKDLFKEDENGMFDSTVSADIAQYSGKFCDSDEDELQESPVYTVGRNGAQDIADHITPAVKKEFKDLVKKIGGKTVAKKLLDEMNSGAPATELPDSE